jgi:hypothetical protein
MGQDNIIFNYNDIIICKFVALDSIKYILISYILLLLKKCRKHNQRHEISCTQTINKNIFIFIHIFYENNNYNLLIF